VPSANPEIVVVVPDPVAVTPAGVPEIVHPDEGKPLSITLPVANIQVVWVIIPITGAVGVAGCAFITTLAGETDVQPAALVTV
jgi:hypothetical protein